MSKLLSPPKTSLLFVLLALNAPLFAGELAGVKLPDAVVLEGQPKVLNGLGLRLATFFKVKVYVAGLYVSEKSPDSAKHLGDTSSKLVRMSFLRDVDAEILGEAFSDGFEKACKGDECKTFGEAVKAFVKLQPDVKQGETLDFELLQAEIIVKKNDKELGRVAGVGLGQVVLRVWIGDNPPNPELKVGLLGK
jgi:hypothetical protein